MSESLLKRRRDAGGLDRIVLSQCFPVDEPGMGVQASLCDGLDVVGVYAFSGVLCHGAYGGDCSWFENGAVGLLGPVDEPSPGAAVKYFVACFGGETRGGFGARGCLFCEFVSPVRASDRWVGGDSVLAADVGQPAEPT